MLSQIQEIHEKNLGLFYQKTEKRLQILMIIRIFFILCAYFAYLPSLISKWEDLEDQEKLLYELGVSGNVVRP